MQMKTRSLCGQPSGEPGNRIWPGNGGHKQRKRQSGKFRIRYRRLLRGRPYVDIIMDAAAQSGVSPYIIASMILVEQGKQGTGRSISGTVSGYTGYYNFFNIEAYQSGSMSAVERGLWWASHSGSYGRPWNTREKSILGGAKWYAENYLNRGQDTLYLKKFNVQGSSPYTHQYMTNVQAAASEEQSLPRLHL